MEAIADLHTHTIFSDGSLTPEELLKKAQKAGLSAIGITDHDTIDGCVKAHSVADKYNIELMDGIELSCYEENREYHILGYNIDIDNKVLRNHLVEFRESRLKRAEKILQKLNQIDIPLSFDTILEKAGQAPITRPHIASAMLDQGYISSLKEAFNLYIGEGRPAYQPKHPFTVDKAIKLINLCGGVAVLAHPGKMVSQDALYKMIEKGLDGIEVIHPSHDESLQKFYKSIANQYWLLETGGSDFHGNREYDAENFGKFVVSGSVVESIKYHAQRK